jgi:hypothetical protein
MARLGLRDLGGPFLSALPRLPEAKGLWLGSIALTASPTSNFRVSHGQAEMDSKAKSGGMFARSPRMRAAGTSGSFQGSAHGYEVVCSCMAQAGARSS